MDQKPTSPSFPTIQPGTSSPPNQGANRTSVSVSALEIMVTFGHSRVIIDPKTGIPAQNPAVEWLTSFTLSPTAAEQLFKTLEIALVQYVGQFGKIPQDPAAMAQLEGFLRQARERVVQTATAAAIKKG